MLWLALAGVLPPCPAPNHYALSGIVRLRGKPPHASRKAARGTGLDTFCMSGAVKDAVEGVGG